MKECGWVKNGGKCILEQENKELKEKMNEILDRNIKYNVEIVDLLQENKQLKDNWNKLKEWMQKELVDSKAASGYSFYLKSWLDKMQELERL